MSFDDNDTIEVVFEEGSCAYCYWHLKDSTKRFCPECFDALLSWGCIKQDE